MAIKPTVALRAILVGGIAAFAKVATAMKAAGGAKVGVAAAAMSAACRQQQVLLCHQNKNQRMTPSSLQNELM